MKTGSLALSESPSHSGPLSVMVPERLVEPRQGWYGLNHVPSRWPPTLIIVIIACKRLLFYATCWKNSSLALKEPCLQNQVGTL